MYKYEVYIVDAKYLMRLFSCLAIICFAGMKKKAITMLLELNSIAEFQDIFRALHFHRTQVSKAIPIGYYRLGTVINDPSKMTLGELSLLVNYFSVQREILLRPIDNQIITQERKRRKGCRP